MLMFHHRRYLVHGQKMMFRNSENNFHPQLVATRLVSVLSRNRLCRRLQATRCSSQPFRLPFVPHHKPRSETIAAYKLHRSPATRLPPFIDSSHLVSSVRSTNVATHLIYAASLFPSLTSFNAFIVPCSACLWLRRNFGSVPLREGYLWVLGL